MPFPISKLFVTITDINHYYFAEMLRQLSALDVRLLSMFKNHRTTYALCDVQEFSDGHITPYKHSLFDFQDKNCEFSDKERLALTPSLENLIRLGLVLKNRAIIQLGYNYENFKNTSLYSFFLQTKTTPESDLSIIPARIELTDLGNKFVSFFNINQ